MELPTILKKYWPWFLAAAAVFVTGVPMFVGMCVLALSSLEESQPKNAVCPICGHQFHIEYRAKNNMSSLCREHRCPECGQRSSEYMFRLFTDENREAIEEENRKIRERNR